jgi:hypothetical protein
MNNLVKILLEGKCHPLVISVATGLSTVVSAEATMEVNAELFPPNLYEEVQVVSGFVAVTNPVKNGCGSSNKGSHNTVKYLVGVPFQTPKNAWDFTPTVPPSSIVQLKAGTFECLPEYNSDDQSLSPASKVIVVQTRKVKELTAVFDKHRLCQYEVLRSNGPRWAFIS